MSRTEARELFMKLLFQMEAQNDFNADIKTRFYGENLKGKKQEKYLEKMYSLIGVNLPEVDKYIESCCENWKIGRISKIDLAVMRTAVLEMLYMADIPESVSINEAVDIAKKYGTEDSGKFVNGVLGKIAKIKHAN